MPHRLDNNGRWHVELCIHGQRVHRRLPPGATEGDAKLLLAQLTVALAQRRAPVVPGDPPLAHALATYVAHAQKNSRSPASAQHHAQRIGLWADKYTCGQATQCAKHIMADMAGHYAPATINRSLATLKKGLSLLWEDGHTPENYGARIKLLPVHNAREVYLSVAQVQAIAQHCQPAMQAAIWAALLTGARRGEVLEFGKMHLIGASTISILAKGTKTLKSRTIPIVPALRPWLAYFPLQTNFEGLKTAWRRAREAAGMAHVNFHDLRHSCASIMIEMGVDLYTVGEILGHANPNTTKRYAHLQTQRKRDALDKVSALTIDVVPPPRRVKG